MSYVKLKNAFSGLTTQSIGITRNLLKEAAVAFNRFGLTTIPDLERDYDAFGDGINDDRPALVKAEAGSPIKGYSISNTILVNSNITLNAPIRSDGGILKPALGVVITLNGPVPSGPIQWIDLSQGTVDFSDNKFIRRYLLQWFGIKGDGTNESALMNKIAALLPRGAEVELSNNLHVYLGGTVSEPNIGWHIPAGKEGVKFRARSDPRQGGVANAYGSLIYTGPAGGTVCLVDSSTFIEVSGFVINSGQADIVIDLDFVNGHIGSNCLVEKNVLSNNNGRPNWVGIRIAKSVNSNHEYHEIRKNIIRGGGGGLKRFSSGLNITVGTPTLTVAGDQRFYFGGDGVRSPGRCWVKGAGNQGKSGDVLIANVISSSYDGVNTTVILDTNALATVANASGNASAQQGIGIQQSPLNGSGYSSNVHQTRYELNDMEGLKSCIEVNNGNFHSWRNTLFYSDTLYDLRGNSMGCTIAHDNNEGCFQAIKGSTLSAGLQYPVKVTSGRYEVSYALVGHGYYENHTGVPFSFEQSTLENSLPSDSYLFDFPNRYTLRVEDMRISNKLDRSVVGVEFGTQHISNIPNLFSSGTIEKSHHTEEFGSIIAVERLEESVAGLRGIGYITGGGAWQGVPYVAGVWGEGNKSTGPNFLEPIKNTPLGFHATHPEKVAGHWWAMGVVGTSFADGSGGASAIGNGTRVACFHARMPIVEIEDCDTTFLDHAVGLYVTKAYLPQLNGTTQKLTGVLIEDLSDVGGGNINSSNIFGVDQYGSLVLNKLRGRNYFAAEIEGTNADTTTDRLDNGMFTFTRNEGTDELVITIKKSDGTRWETRLPLSAL